MVICSIRENVTRFFTFYWHAWFATSPQNQCYPGKVLREDGLVWKLCGLYRSRCRVALGISTLSRP